MTSRVEWDGRVVHIKVVGTSHLVTFYPIFHGLTTA